MILVYFPLWIALTAPALLVSVALHLPALCGFFAILAAAATAGLAWSAQAGFEASLNPEPVTDEMRQRLERLWSRNGPERMQALFFIYRSTRSEMRVWAHSARKFSIYFSRGFVEQMTDRDLHAVFRKLVEARPRDLMIENHREALRGLFDRWKGDERAFRYWFFSFWLHPLERILKIARI